MTKSLQFPACLQSPGTVWVDDFPPQGGPGHSALFQNPREILEVWDETEIAAALEQVDRALEAGLYAAGFLSYDLGLYLDKAIPPAHSPTTPLLWLGFYDKATFIRNTSRLLPEALPDFQPEGEALNLTEAEYRAKVEEALEFIRAGEIYQVNFTCKNRFSLTGSPGAFFAALRAAHPVCHSAYVNGGEFQILSFSPELFLRRRGQWLETRPMKGTARRGRWFEEDRAQAQALQEDPKNRAENVMIVDLMRNDLGRLCETGSVSVPRLFDIEQYDSLFQMTSTVQGRLAGEKLSLEKLLRATFPAGSITGAPKIRAMEIINDLEAESRGPYCGALGYFAPEGDLLLNVAIRTVLHRNGQCEMGLGSGIVADSDPAAEWEETQTKGRFLQGRPRDFQILETLLWQPGTGWSFLEAHLLRMARSASYFLFPFQARVAARLLEEKVASCQKLSRVRLLLSQDGQMEVERFDFSPQVREAETVGFSEERVHSGDIFLYHKTTRRQLYNREWKKAQEQGWMDILFLNEREEVTEGAISNLVLEKEGQWWTPPLESGVLPGIYRQHLLGRGRLREKRLYRGDLQKADRLYLINSVRAMTAVQI